MKTVIIAIVLLLLSSPGSISQNNDSLYYTIDLTKSIQIPADEIIFNVNLSVENSDPKFAHSRHKELEKKLLTVLEEFNIQDTSVTFALISIRNQGHRSIEPHVFRTDQKVRFKLGKMEDYTNMQLKLLQNGIFSFEASFSSSVYEKSRSLGVEKALKEARKDAEIYAKNLNKKVAKLVEVSSNLYERNISSVIHFADSQVMSKSGLIDIPQFVTNSVQLKAKFLLVNNY